MKLRKILDPTIRAAVRNLKRGVIIPPPTRTTFTREQDQWWIQELKAERRRLEAEVKRRASTPDKRLLAIFDVLDSTRDSRLPEECALRRHLGKLDPRKRASLILAYVDGCTHREIAEQLGVPIGTAKAWIRRSLIALRADLD